MPKESTKVDPKERANRIRDCFEKWDKDGNGYITKAELVTVIVSLLPEGQTLTRHDVDLLMQEADKNCNGRIEYNEFAEWLTRPGGSVHADDGGVEFFKLSEVLQPLFEVYDRNGDRTISPEEFEECHSILQTALTLHPTGPAKEAGVLESHAKLEFLRADRDNDERVTFEEFVEWQRHALERSGLTNTDLEDLVPALARQLLRIFKLSDSNEQGLLTQSDHKVLNHITVNLANFARDIYNAEEANHSSLRGRHHYTNRWSDPPVGLNVARLKGQFLKLYPVPTWGVASVDLGVLCVPSPELGDIRHRRWLAKVVRHTHYKGRGRIQGRTEVDDPVYFVWEDLQWVRQKVEAEYNEAYDQLPPELRFFCVLKTEANFGIEITWDQIQAAFRVGMQLSLITQRQFQDYNKTFADLVFKTMRQQDLLADIPDKQEQWEEMERLRAKTVQAPRDVMATLVELGTLKVTSVWADVLKA